MKSVISLTLVAALATSAVPVAAQEPVDPTAGPIHRATMRETIWLTAGGAPTRPHPTGCACAKGCAAGPTALRRGRRLPVDGVEWGWTSRTHRANRGRRSQRPGEAHRPTCPSQPSRRRHRGSGDDGRRLAETGVPFTVWMFRFRGGRDRGRRRLRCPLRGDCRVRRAEKPRRGLSCTVNESMSKRLKTAVRCTHTDQLFVQHPGKRKVDRCRASERLTRGLDTELGVPNRYRQIVDGPSPSRV